jgi:hypothetical protein
MGRRYLLMACVLLGMLGLPILGSAQTTTPTPQQTQAVAAILAQFPAGGPGLRAAIARAVEANPSLAYAVVAAAATANPDQQKAMGEGMADARDFYAKLGSPFAVAAQQLIQSAILSAPPAMLIAFNIAVQQSSLALAIPGTGGPSVTTNTCVSPSRPGNGC